MSMKGYTRPARASGLPFFLSASWLVVLLLSGGASRVDVLGQSLVRAAGFVILFICIVIFPKPEWKRYAAVGWFLVAVTGLVAIQLIPLPPAFWQVLPGRPQFVELSVLLGEEAIWRPLSISPGWTFNALGSLVVAATTFILLAALNKRQHFQLLPLLLGLAFASVLMGLLQFSGADFDHPLVNDIEGEVSGFFANRNHFALFLAIATAIVPVWAFDVGGRSEWRVFVGIGFVLLLLLMILAIGSRAGMLLAAVALVLGTLAVGRQVRHHLQQLPKWGRIAILAAGSASVGGGVLSAVLANRAVSIDRVMDSGLDDHVRSEAYSTVIEMIFQYFPFGTGFGTFDPAYRITEPSTALRPEYLNQAHSDLLQVVLEGGLGGLVLLLYALSWVGLQSWRAWSADGARLARLGSAITLLIVLASAVDYPARTPFIMSMATLAAIWLSRPADPYEAS